MKELYIELGLEPEEDLGEVEAEESGVVSLKSVWDLEDVRAKLRAW